MTHFVASSFELGQMFQVRRMPSTSSRAPKSMLSSAGQWLVPLHPAHPFLSGYRYTLHLDSRHSPLLFLAHSDPAAEQIICPRATPGGQITKNILFISFLSHRFSHILATADAYPGMPWAGMFAGDAATVLSSETTPCSRWASCSRHLQYS